MQSRACPVVASGKLHRLFCSSSTFSRPAQRRFSVLSIHTHFPASLFHLSDGRGSHLFDHTRSEGHSRLLDDGVEVHKTGLVFPAVSDNVPSSNGAIFMPNTYFMQELVRTFVDEHIEELENGGSGATPIIYRIPKGTPIPSTLILLHEYNCRYSLQPSQGVPLSALNDMLVEFYEKHAESQTAEQWLDANDFESAVADDAVLKWTAT